MSGINLLPKENVLLEYGIHWKRYVVPFSGICASLFILTVRLWFFGQPLILALNRYMPNVMTADYRIISIMEIALCLVFLSWSLTETVSCLTTTYCLTTQRIIAKKGWLNIRVTEMMVRRCETITISRSIFGRILNYGDIKAISAGASIFLDDVPHPERFRETIISYEDRPRKPTNSFVG